MKKQIILDKIAELGVDAIISIAPQTRLWYTGFSSTDGKMVFTKDEAILYVDARYFEKASNEVTTATVKLLNPESIKTLHEYGFKTVGIESNYVTLDEQKTISTQFKVDDFKTFNGQSLRIKKSREEINFIKKACEISLLAIADTIKAVKPGMTEIEVRNILSDNQYKHGGDKDSFDAIVVSGKRGSLPHGNPTDKIIEDGDLVTIDFGCMHKGYCSDITRTFHVGNVTDEKILDIEKVLREAQRLGKLAVKPGVTTLEVDKVCRDYITSKGYGEYFAHSTGHGLGIDVHELPNVSQSKAYEVTLEPGMIITVEPGIYIPGVGGIRVEDDVLVTKEGHEVLSTMKGGK